MISSKFEFAISSRWLSVHPKGRWMLVCVNIIGATSEPAMPGGVLRRHIA